MAIQQRIPRAPPPKSRQITAVEHEKLFSFVPTGDWVCVSEKAAKTKPTSCRLERDYREVLDSRAKDLNLKPAELVRKYIVAGLKEDATKVTLHEELPAISEELKQLRRDLSLLAEALVIRAGNMEPAAARAWAVKNFAAR